MKPGWQTTEFWVTIAIVILSALASSGVIGSKDDPWPTLLSLIAAGLAGSGYALSRGLTKKAG